MSVPKPLSLPSYRCTSLAVHQTSPTAKITKRCENDNGELEAKRVKQECAMALKRMFQNFEAQLKGDDVDQMSKSSSDFDDQVSEQELTPELHHSLVSNLVVVMKTVKC